MKIFSISIAEVEYTAFWLAKEMMTWDEKIPDFSSRFPNILESCLNSPFQSFGGEVLYKGLVEKASILFYLMIKNHPFQNGNKRIAMTTLFYFLYKNKKWIEVDNVTLYNFAKQIASSDPRLQKGTIKIVQNFIKNYMVDFDLSVSNEKTA